MKVAAILKLYCTEIYASRITLNVLSNTVSSETSNCQSGQSPCDLHVTVGGFTAFQ